MEHLVAVGTVTDAARVLIEQQGWRVWHVSDMPSVTLVRLPNPQFCGVVQKDGHISRALLRVRLAGCSLIWQGESEHGPEITSVDKTMLKAEDEYEVARR